MQTKADILHLLGQAPGRVVSGQKLSDHLGISRVAVWKHIDHLRGKGYRIEGGPKGYRLSRTPDIPFAWEFPARVDLIHYVEKTASTMTRARELAHKGCPHMTTVIADQQTEGRGRLRREWHSAAGGLYFTCVVRPAVPASQGVRVGFAASAMMAEVINRRYDIPARVKWPNDILVEGRKLCGMLSEMGAEADRILFVNIGMGLNLNNPLPADLPQACSISNLLGRKVSRCNLMAEFLDRFQEALSDPSLDSALERWKHICITLNRPVTISTTRQEHRGLAVDVDGDGALLLKGEDGRIQRVLYGDCFHR